MLQWGLDNDLGASPLKKGCERVGTPLPSSPSSPARPVSSQSYVPDRFIPRRGGIPPFEHAASIRLTEAAEGSGKTSEVESFPAKRDYRQALRAIILPHAHPCNKKILPVTLLPTSPGSHIPDGRFFSPASPGGSDCGGAVCQGASGAAGGANAKKARLIPKSPDKMLDAPDIGDDWYLNILDWSPSNIVAIVLGQGVYLWNASTGTVQVLQKKNSDIVTSLTWGSGSTLAVGMHSAEVQLWDVAANAPTRVMRGHTSRVANLAWASPSTLTSGARDSLIIHHDVRAKQHKTATLEGHSGEVCGLAWSPSGSQLVRFAPSPLPLPKCRAIAASPDIKMQPAVTANALEPDASG